jgi:hypothetical protein
LEAIEAGISIAHTTSVLVDFGGVNERHCDVRGNTDAISIYDYGMYEVDIPQSRRI